MCAPPVAEADALREALRRRARHGRRGRQAPPAVRLGERAHPPRRRRRAGDVPRARGDRRAGRQRPRATRARRSLVCAEELAISDDALVAEGYSDLLLDGPQVLLRAADAAMRTAYAPYSAFPVGAAVRSASGRDLRRRQRRERRLSAEPVRRGLGARRARRRRRDGDHRGRGRRRAGRALPAVRRVPSAAEGVRRRATCRCTSAARARRRTRSRSPSCCRARSVARSSGHERRRRRPRRARSGTDPSRRRSSGPGSERSPTPSPIRSSSPTPSSPASRSRPSPDTPAGRCSGISRASASPCSRAGRISTRAATSRRCGRRSAR